MPVPHPASRTSARQAANSTPRRRSIGRSTTPVSPARSQICEQMVGFGIMQQHSESQDGRKTNAATPASSIASIRFRRRIPPPSGQASGAAVTRSGAAFCRSSCPEIVATLPIPGPGSNRCDHQRRSISLRRIISVLCSRLMRRLDPPSLEMPRLALGAEAGPDRSMGSDYRASPSRRRPCGNAERGRSAC